MNVPSVPPVLSVPGEELERAKALNRELLDKLEAMEQRLAAVSKRAEAIRGELVASHQKNERYLKALTDSERELAQLREAGTPACSTPETAPVNTLPTAESLLPPDEEALCQLQASLSTMSLAAQMIIDAYDPRYFRAGAWAKSALKACQEPAPRASAASPVKSAQPVNQVNPVNPVPAPETFEAHGHTWTRHTPGDPCPVHPDTRVHVYDGIDDIGPYAADEFTWHAERHLKLGSNIIGWRHATPEARPDAPRPEPAASDTPHAPSSSHAPHTPAPAAE